MRRLILFDSVSCTLSLFPPSLLTLVEPTVFVHSEFCRSGLLKVVGICQDPHDAYVLMGNTGHDSDNTSLLRGKPNIRAINLILLVQGRETSPSGMIFAVMPLMLSVVEMDIAN